MVAVKPYYSDDHVTIYHGDCLELMPSLTFDCIITDPPYGIALDTDYSSWNGSTRTYEPIVGDESAFDPTPFLGWPVAMFGANHFAHLLPSGGTWHVWDKRDRAKSNFLSDFEIWWTSYPSGPSRIHRHQWICGVHPGTRPERISHPTVKPVPVLAMVVHTRPESDVILDPFMGSGSTLRAAKDLGRRAIGIELEERYCEIAAQRCAQEVLAL